LSCWQLGRAWLGCWRFEVELEVELEPRRVSQPAPRASAHRSERGVERGGEALAHGDAC